VANVNHTKQLQLLDGLTDRRIEPFQQFPPLSSPVSTVQSDTTVEWCRCRR